MEAKFAQSFQFPMQIDSERIVWRSSSSILTTWQCNKLQHPRMLTVSQSQQKKTANQHRPVQFEVLGSFQHSPAPNLESRSVKPSFDDASILKEMSQEIVPYLNGRSIYLVGMMGCGKTTVGKVLSEVLNYSFVDSDKLIEQTMGELPVAEIFKLYGEKFFRDMETEVLLELSLRHRTVASTGGGAVIRPINWEYMQGGISVWLDVPLKALAQRIAAVGTKSRPLLQIEPGDVIEKTYGRLSALWEERSEAYTNADARVSLERIAAKLGQRDVSSLTPEVIAIEVLEQIVCFLREEDGMNIPEL